MTRIAALWILLSACGPSPQPDAGARDAAIDARPPDARAGDASRPVDARAAADGSDVDASAPLPACAFDEVFVLDALDLDTPGSDEYAIPSEARLDALERSITLALDGDRSSAASAASEADYELCADGELLVWRPIDVTGQARVALRPAARRALILEAPHPFHDRDTLIESSALFRSLEARALIASGTHRCVSTAPGCEGRSDACGAPSGYRRSDAAHNVLATFQRAHEAIAERFATDVVVSVHGFADDGASLSDGTTDPVADSAPVARLARALASAGITGVTSCNSGAGVPTEARLCGTTNTQGRHVNGSPDACGARAPGASGRFVHLEQSRAVRASLDAVLAAFEATF